MIRAFLALRPDKVEAGRLHDCYYYCFGNFTGSRESSSLVLRLTKFAPKGYVQSCHEAQRSCNRTSSAAAAREQFYKEGVLPNNWHP